MYKILSFLSKSPELSPEEFKNYYENHHVPLIRSLAPTPDLYKRRYIIHEHKLTDADDGVDFDAVTELAFKDRGRFLAWMGKLASAGETVATDEARFLDRSRTRAYVVDEQITSE